MPTDHEHKPIPIYPPIPKFSQMGGVEASAAFSKAISEIVAIVAAEDKRSAKKRGGVIAGFVDYELGTIANIGDIFTREDTPNQTVWYASWIRQRWFTEAVDQARAIARAYHTDSLMRERLRRVEELREAEWDLAMAGIRKAIALLDMPVTRDVERKDGTTEKIPATDYARAAASLMAPSSAIGRKALGIDATPSAALPLSAQHDEPLPPMTDDEIRTRIRSLADELGDDTNEIDEDTQTA